MLIDEVSDAYGIRKTVAAYRYGQYTVTRDPDEGWMNCGAYRAMIHKKSVGCFMVTGKHGYVHRNKYWRRASPARWS